MATVTILYEGSSDIQAVESMYTAGLNIQALSILRTLQLTALHLIKETAPIALNTIK